MAFGALKDYNLSFPKFNTPDLSDVFANVAAAYRSDKSGENIGAGISAAGKAFGTAITDIPKNQQEADLNKAKIDQLNATTAATKQNGLIAIAPQGIAVAPNEPGYIPQPATTGRLTGISTPSASPASSGLIQPETPTNRLAGLDVIPDIAQDPSLLFPDESPDPVAVAAQNIADTTAPGRNGSLAPRPDLQTAAGRAATRSMPLTQPELPVSEGHSYETLPGGVVVGRLNGVATEIKNPGDTKMGPLTKSEESVLNPKTGTALTAGEKLAMAKEGIDPESPTAMADYLAAQKAKTAIPKLDRDMQKRVNELNISTAGKTADQVRAEAADALAKSHQLSDAQITHINNVATRYKTEPPYKNWVSVTDGFENALQAATLKTGLGDKTLIEEGQRILNPNAAVAVQTMKNFGASSGLLERLTPDYIIQNVTKGAILTDAQRKEYLGVLQNALVNRSKEMERTREKYIGEAEKARVPRDASEFYLSNPYEEAVSRIKELKSEQAKAAPDVSEAAAWLQANPNDPRAAAVRQKLEALGFK